MKVLLCVLGLLLSFELVAGSLEWFELSKSDHDHSGLVVRETRDRATSEIVNELRQRRSAGSPPNDTSKFTFDGDSNNNGIISYSGGDSKVIFVLTYAVARTQQQQRTTVRSSLYRSTDYGKHFNNITDQVTKGPHVLYQNIYVAPNNNNILVFSDSQHAQIYVTQNEGNTFTTQQLSPSTVDPKTILFHPTLYTHFLIYDPTNNVLYATTNLGKTLTKLSDNVPLRQYQWGVAPYDTDITTVYYNVYNPNDRNRGDYTVPLFKKTAPYSTNVPVEFDSSLGKHDDFLIVGRYMFVQKSVSGVVSLWVSYDRKPFLMAHIPSTLPHQNYIVDSIKSMQALVIVQHVNNQFNLYLSEETGQHFSLSLPDLVVANGGIDLELVDSMNATYIANQNIGSSIRTLISFDNGGNWQLLRPPALTSCQPPSCSLHLHMSSTQYWRTGVYSQQSAPGIIIAHGTTGASLSSDPDLYVSSDGGINWRQALQSSWGVTVLDHGGLIVAAKDYFQGNSSSVLKYSCDEGATWKSFKFSDTDITIFGVITEPGETTTVVSLYGVEEFTTPEWTVIQIDFKSVFTGQCQPTDYYWWHPWDERSSTECLLGSKISIQRRKPSVCCLNNQQFSRVIDYAVCACVSEDFECDYGYMHPNGYNGPCVRDSAISLPDMCQGNITHYVQSKGYRKIGGDVCTGGSEVSYQAVEVPCCKGFISSSDTVSILLGVFLAITLAVIVAQFGVIVVILLKMKKKFGTRDYSQLPTEERYVVRADSPPITSTANMNIQQDDDDPLIDP